MGYALEAILGSQIVLRALVAGLPDAPAVVVGLGQGIAMVPMTDALFDALSDGDSDKPLGFWKLPSGFDRTLTAVSQHVGPIAYVEAEFFGGDGTQRAIVWTAGRVSLGPLQSEEGQPFSAEGSPISQCLSGNRLAGVLSGEASGHDDDH